MSFKNVSSFSRIPTAIQLNLAKNQRILRIILSVSPAQLKPYIKDCVVNEESLMIYVSSAVWASQLRFCSAQIQTAVNTQSKENIRKIRVRVLAPTPFKAEKKSRKIIPSAENIESLRNNADTLSEGRLKNALFSLSNTLLKQNK
ncbi:MAG: DciA family protein [Methyloprofundus sp.]|nr:DciA family protein [Methyloprofundus sp.]MDT8424905.1 DciA family protein [Methyloprofundus sp.]